MLGSASVISRDGRVIWITGLSKAGKSTLGREVARRLRASGVFVVLLDGDEIRDALGPAARNTDSYSREGRLDLAQLYGRLCRMLAAQGVTVVIATISMFDEVYAWNRQHLPGYFEVYLRASIDELRPRDALGLYADRPRASAERVAGRDLEVDEPSHPDMTIEISASSRVEETADAVLASVLGDANDNK